MKKKFTKISLFSYSNSRNAFIKEFPELKDLSNLEIEDRLYRAGISFFTSDKAETKWYIRLTLPFAIIAICLGFILLPINYIITGRWHYKNVFFRNWIVSLGF